MPTASPLFSETLSPLESALQTLSSQKKGLEALEKALKDSLKDNFEEVVQLLAQLQGHVIFTAMGKSGHIARKIQATFASIGIPSLYIHPSEAAHGDLGMITKNDVLFILSNSGETPELAPIITYSSSLGIHKIALTSNISSSLAQSAETALILPTSQEACPMGLAPTTSTLLQLALGDALAIALLHQKKFNKEDFSLLHPAGQLGKFLQPISRFMHQGETLPLGSKNMPLHQVILEITKKSFGCMGVIDENNILVGLIADGDLRPALERDITCLKAEDIMNPHPLTAPPHLLAQEALHLMNHRQTPVNSLFIVDSEYKPLGILHLHDILRAGILT